MGDKATYTMTEHDDGRITLGIDHPSGGFVVSNPAVGQGLALFLNNATTTDIHVLHSHLLYAYHYGLKEMEEMDLGEDHWGRNT